MYNQEAEIDLVGNLILDPQKIDNAQGLERDDFSDVIRWELYEAVRDMTGDDCNDTVEIVEYLKRSEATAGHGDINWHMENCMVSSKTAYLADQIKTYTAKRKTLGLIDNARGSVHDDHKTFFDKIETALSDIKSRLNFGKSFSTIKKLLRRYLNEMQGRVDGTIKYIAEFTGLEDVDDIIGGFRQGALVIIAGRPGMGKTAAAIQIADNIAKTGRVAIFSLEMTEDELTERMISAKAKVDSVIMNRYPQELTEADHQRIGEAANEIGSCNNILVDDSSGTTVLDIRSKSRQLHAEKPLKAIVIDYLQLMDGVPGADSRRGEVTFMTRKLKQLAKELKIPVIALAQLNRLNTARSNPRPVMADLKESGSIEEDANVIVLLHREEYYCDKCKAGEDCSLDHKGLAEWIIDKNRGGPVGIARVVFLAKYTLFRSFSRH